MMNPFLHFAGWKLGLLAAGAQPEPAEADSLRRHARDRRRLVSLGLQHGAATRVLREVMAPDAVLYAVDPFPIGGLGVSLEEKIARSEIGGVRRGDVRWIDQTGRTALGTAQAAGLETVDFVMLNAERSYEGVRADWDAWSPLVEPGGVIVVRGAGGAREEIREPVGFEKIEEGNGLAVWRWREAR